MVKLVDTRDLKSLASQRVGSIPTTRTIYAVIAQLVEQLPCKHQVPSSILGDGTILIPYILFKNFM